MSVKTWLWRKFASKVIKAAVLGLIAIVGADKLTDFGLQIDETQLTIGLLALLEGLRNYLKVKVGIKFI